MTGARQKNEVENRNEEDCLSAQERFLSPVVREEVSLVSSEEDLS